MDRSWKSGAAVGAPTYPGAPSIGYPNGGDPLTATPATVPGSWWYHMITEELRAIVVAAGATPLGSAITQVRDALYALFGRLAVANVWTKGQVGQYTALPATTGTVTLDFSQSNNWNGTLTGNILLANPSTMPVGLTFMIDVTNGASPYTIAYGSYFKSPSGALPALTAVAGARDKLVGIVDSATSITVSMLGDIK